MGPHIWNGLYHSEFEHVVEYDAKMTYLHHEGHKVPKVKVIPRSGVKIRYCNNSGTGRSILAKSCVNIEDQGFKVVIRSDI